VTLKGFHRGVCLTHIPKGLASRLVSLRQVRQNTKVLLRKVRNCRRCRYTSRFNFRSCLLPVISTSREIAQCVLIIRLLAAPCKLQRFQVGRRRQTFNLP